MTHKKMFQLLTLTLFVAMVVVLPLQAADGCQEKAACEKKLKAEGCEKTDAKGCEKMAAEGCEKKMQAEGCDKMKGEGCMMLKAIPNLSDEQKGKLEKLHAEHQAMMAAAMAEMQKKCQAHQEAVRALLTDEQKAKLPEMGGCGKMHGMGCKMGHEQKQSADCKMKADTKMDHSKCQKAEEGKKEEKK
jgi:hypothetical protein